MTNDSDNKLIDDVGCIEAIDKLYAYLDGEIDKPGTIGKLEHHLQHCHACFTRSQLETELTKRMKKAAKTPAPGSLKKRLDELIGGF